MKVNAGQLLRFQQKKLELLLLVKGEESNEKKKLSHCSLKRLVWLDAVANLEIVPCLFLEHKPYDC